MNQWANSGAPISILIVENGPACWMILVSWQTQCMDSIIKEETWISCWQGPHKKKTLKDTISIFGAPLSLKISLEFDNRWSGLSSFLVLSLSPIFLSSSSLAVCFFCFQISRFFKNPNCVLIDHGIPRLWFWPFNSRTFKGVYKPWAGIHNFWTILN